MYIMKTTTELAEYMQHPKWGVGRIIGNDGTYAEVVFATEGRKRFARAFMEQHRGVAPDDETAAALAKACKGMNYAAPGVVEAAKKEKKPRVKRPAGAKAAAAAAEARPDRDDD